MIAIRFRPISTWPAGAYTPAAQRKACPFGASYPDTLEQLDRELPGGETVVVESDVSVAPPRSFRRRRPGILGRIRFNF